MLEFLLNPCNYWHLIFIDDIANTICQIFQFLFNKNMIKVSDIYVSTTGPVHWLINICLFRKTSQHYILAHPDYNNISIENYKR